MKKALILSLITIGSLSFFSFVSPENKLRPNILIIYIDDLHHEKFGFKGDPIIKTPNIDALAKEGITFQNAFAVTAICITSCGNFMTGQYAARTGNYFDGFEKLTQKQVEMSFPYRLHEAGYYTGYVGKWHQWKKKLDE